MGKAFDQLKALAPDGGEPPLPREPKEEPDRTRDTSPTPTQRPAATTQPTSTQKAPTNTVPEGWPSDKWVAYFYQNALKRWERLLTEWACVETPTDPRDWQKLVKAAREMLKWDPLMQDFVSPQRQPRIASNPGKRSALLYEAVIDQFDVDIFKNRYHKGGGRAKLNVPRCNIFAMDVMYAMGVPLPWGSVKDTILPYLVKQSKNPPDSNSWHEIKIDPTTNDGLSKLIEHLNSGKPALVAYVPPKDSKIAKDSPHIAVLRPNQKDVKKMEDLRIAQAGAACFMNGNLKRGFATNTPPEPLVRFPSLRFFYHD